MRGEKPKFHVTITDNETGQVYHDTDACVVLGAIGDGEKTWETILTNCSGTDMMMALSFLYQLIYRLRAQRKELDLIASSLEAFAKHEINKEENKEKGE